VIQPKEKKIDEGRDSILTGQQGGGRTFFKDLGVTDIKNKIKQRDFHGFRLDRHVHLEKNVHQEESLTNSDGRNVEVIPVVKNFELRPGSKHLQNMQLLLRPFVYGIYRILPTSRLNIIAIEIAN
jgi:hypothetical protein